jgi:hypothetical protein
MQGVLQKVYQNNTFDIWWFSFEYPQPYYNHDNDASSSWKEINFSY